MHFLQSLSSCCNSFSLLIQPPVQIPVVKSQYQGFCCGDIRSDRDIVLVTAPGYLVDIRFFLIDHSRVMKITISISPRSIISVNCLSPLMLPGRTCGHADWSLPQSFCLWFRWHGRMFLQNILINNTKSSIREAFFVGLHQYQHSYSIILIFFYQNNYSKYNNYLQLLF